MRIAVCIHNNKIKIRLRSLFACYGEKNGVTFGHQFFENDIDLLYNLKGGDYDAIFLDLSSNMPQLIYEIREKDKQVRLVPVATVEQWVEQGYGKDIWYCLPSPVSQAFLFAILDRLDSAIKHDIEAGMVIKSRQGIVHVSFSNLEYVEVINKTVCFHLIDGRIEEVSASLAGYEARLLYWPEFVKIHRAYIINLRYIQKLESNSIITRSGHSVPISRHLFQNFKKDYMCWTMDPDIKPQKIDTLELAKPEPKGKYTILLVDDEEDQRVIWSQVLVDNGCQVQVADCGTTALWIAKQGRFDCVILDVKLRDGEEKGFDICNALKEITNAPVVFLSNYGDSESQMQGFLSGGIDYITKDTSRELFWLKVETRIKMTKVVKSELCNKSLHVNLKERKVFLEEQEVSLTTVEFDLLYLLMKNPGAVYAPMQLYSMVWGSQYWDEGQTVQLHLSQLRRKLENVYPQHSFIETIWGKGYCFNPMP